MPIFSGVTISGGFSYEAPPPPVIPFVAISSNGTNRVMTSPDGINWTARQAAAERYWAKLAYGNGTFVAGVGGGTEIMYSTDNGETWTGPITITSTASQIRSLRFINNQFVAIFDSGSNKSSVSTDGINWTPQSTSFSFYYVRDITYANGTYYVAAENSSRGYLLSSSSLSSTFSLLFSFTSNATNTALTQFFQIAYDNGILVSAGQPLFSSPNDNSALSYSTDGGTNWTAGIGAANNITGRRQVVAFGNGIWVATGITSTGIAISTDNAVNWTYDANALPAAYSGYGLTYKNGKFVGVGTNGSIIYSEDGTSWSTVAAPEPNEYLAVV